MSILIEVFLGVLLGLVGGYLVWRHDRECDNRDQWLRL